MPTPDASEYTNRLKLLAREQSTSDPVKRNYFTGSYSVPVGSVVLSNFLSSISKNIPQPIVPALPIILQYNWTQQTSAPTQQYYDIDTTSNFTTQIASRWSQTTGEQGPYISTDSGATWTLKANGITLLTSGSSYTTDVAVADNGTTMYATQRRGFVAVVSSTYDKIYKSTNGGNNWVATSAPDSTWQSMAISPDGTIILAGNANSGDSNYNGTCALSTDGGATWSPINSSGQQWTDVAMSSNGTRMYAVNAGISSLYKSEDSGSTWSTVSTTDPVRAVACSTDGLTVLIGRGKANPGSKPMVSRNGGSSFTEISSLPGGFWDAIAVSGNGNVMAAGMNSSSSIYLSTDAGTTWTQQTGVPTASWLSIGIDSTGNNIIVGPLSGKPYVGTVPAS